MLRTYITTIPLQYTSDLKLVRYAPEAATTSQETITTSFPIRQVMHNTLREGDDAKVIAIVLENADTKSTLALFRAELAEEFAQVGLTVLEANFPYNAAVESNPALAKANFVTIVVPESPSTKNLLHACRNLIVALPEVTQAHACLTYGTKPISQATLCALNCAEQMKRELEIGGTYYGELKREGGLFAKTEDGVGVGTLYNTTAFYRLSNIISQISNPDAANALFGHLLDLQEPEEV